MPKLSIVTPSYNQGQFIKATIDSILSQDFTDFEYIIMDGGSTDETLDILRSYNDPRLTWVSEPDNGQTDAINKGFSRATGDYFAYLNSDDVYKPGAFQRIVEYFDAHSDVDMVFGDCEVIDENGDFQYLRKSHPFDISDLLFLRFHISQPATFWRASVAHQVGDFNASLKIVMDIDYWMRISLQTQGIAYIPDTLAGFRVHGVNKSLDMVATIEEARRILDAFFELPQLPQHLNAQKSVVYANLELILAYYLRLAKQSQKVRTYSKQVINSPITSPITFFIFIIVSRKLYSHPIFFFLGAPTTQTLA